MENVKIATTCGLCAGCRFAVNTAKSQVKDTKTTLFKEIVHNKNVNENLRKLGIEFKENIEDLNINETVIIRAHGEPKSTFEYLDKKGISYIDCTCINVKNIHKLVEEFSNNGYVNVIIGKYGKTTGVMHPEVLGTAGWSKTDVVFIEDEEDVEKLTNLENQKFYVTCQTTFNEQKADILIQEIEKQLANKNNIVEINKSICFAQKAINMSSKKLAEQSDLMIVVGSKNSSNTTELYKNLCNVCKTIFVDDINKWQSILKEEGVKILKNTKIGITAGASTDPEELEILKKSIEYFIK